MLFAHAGQDPNLAFARKFFDTFDVANLVGTPDQGNGLGAEALNFQQVQHGGAIFLQQLGVEGEPSFFKDLLHVQQHALADAGNFQHLFRFADDVSDLVGKRFNGLGSGAVGANAKGILTIDFKQVGSLVEDAGDGAIVHG